MLADADLEITAAACETVHALARGVDSGKGAPSRLGVRDRGGCQLDTAAVWLSKQLKVFLSDFEHL